MNMIVAFLISMILLIILRPLAIKFNLVDYPTERKTIEEISSRGICIFLIINFVFIFIEFHKFTTVLIVTASLILIHGVWDDFVNLKAKIKMAFQVFVSAIMIYATDVKLESLGVIFEVHIPWS